MLEQTGLPVSLSLCALRRDAPAAAQGLREGRVGEGQGGSQEPGVGRLGPAEATAVRVTVKVNLATTPTDRSPTPVSLVRSESPSAADVSTQRLHAFSFPFILSSRETTELFRSSAVKFDQIHDTVTATPRDFLSRKRGISEV